MILHIIIVSQYELCKNQSCSGKLNLDECLSTSLVDNFIL